MGLSIRVEVAPLLVLGNSRASHRSDACKPASVCALLRIGNTGAPAAQRAFVRSGGADALVESLRRWEGDGDYLLAGLGALRVLLDGSDGLRNEWCVRACVRACSCVRACVERARARARARAPPHTHTPSHVPAVSTRIRARAPPRADVRARRSVRAGVRSRARPGEPGPCT